MKQLGATNATPVASPTLAARHTRVLGLGALALAVAMVLIAGGAPAGARSTATSQITVQAYDLTTGLNLPNFTFIVNVDNVGDPASADPLKQPMTGTPSNSELVAVGDQSDATKTLDAGKYLISVRAPDHKIWGAYVDLPLNAGTVRVGLRSGPHPLGKIKVSVFNDHLWTNSAPDDGEEGLAGFHVTLEEQTNSQVAADYWNNPLCTNYLKDASGQTIVGADGKPTVDQANPGGDCLTDANGFIQIENLGPATYFIYVTAPDGTGWHQTTTFDGGPAVMAGVRENDPGTGAPLEVPWTPDAQATTYWFGFAHVQDFASPGTGSISGTTRNWYGFPPYDTLAFGEPVANPYVALSDTASNAKVYMGQGDGDGNFSILNVPAGNYQLSVWDEQQTYIIQFIQVTVTNNGSATDNVNLGDVGLTRWFGWVSGDVYFDDNHNGVRDCTDPSDPTTCEPGVSNFGMDQRWPDGSIKDATVTDANGHYEYPVNEGGPLGKWFVNETGFTRFSAAHTCGDLGTPCADPSLDGQGVSPAAHDEFTGVATPLPTDEGGGLLHNQLVTEGHRSIVDWGKTRYGANETGQIVGITFFDTTRNEFNARLAAAEDYAPAIPDVQVTLEGLGPDNLPNTADDPIMSSYSTDKWHHPKDCVVRDVTGTILTDLNALMGPQCIEVPAIGNVSKDGAFDGGYAFADYCPNGYDDVAAAATPDAPCYSDGTWNGSQWTHSGAHTGTVPLVPGKYITHVWMPKDKNGNGADCNAGATGGTGDKYISDSVTGTQADCLYRIEREADVNVDQGAQFVPQIEPFPCTGDVHTVHINFDVNPRSPYDGAQVPLCDKRLITLQRQQNANADFFLMTNQANGVDVQVPGRIVGFVPDDVYFERDKKSMWYGEPRALENIPIGLYDYAGRLLKTVRTDPNGAYEILVPSIDTWNCPIPQGPCPSMYDVVVNDPGSPDHPNANYNPHYNTESASWDSWPGKWTQLDTPLIPTAGLGCQLPAGTPEVLQVSTPVVNGAGTAAQRQITIIADNIGAAVGSITLTDPRGGTNSRTWSSIATAAQLANPQQGGIVSWGGADGHTIVIQLPQAYTTSLGLLNQFLPGQKQLTIGTAAGIKSINGLTVHVRGTVGTNVYLAAANSVILLPANAANTPHAIQNAIDAAPDNALIVLSAGTYHENLIMWHPVKLQGLGPGGMTGAAEAPNARPDINLANVQGTVLDGRFFLSSRTAWLATLAAHGAYAGINATYPVLEGAAITVVAKTTGAYGTDANRFNAARIDGLEIATTGGARGAGGVQAMAYANSLQITNDVLESDNGTNAGGVALGRPYIDSNNNNVYIGNDRVIGSGGIDFGGGIAIFRGNSNYEIAKSNICSNFSFNYGAGISHWGRSTGGSIHDNAIYYNEGVDSGAGLAIQQEAARPGDPNQLGVGTGDVTVSRNLIQQNMSGDDGGGLYINRAQGDQVIVRNNLIVGNGAANKGGGLQLVDSSNVRIINNTIADNVSTGSSEQSDHNPHAAGLGSDLSSPLYQATLAATAPNFSNPRALFNNIIWNNEAWTLQGNGPGATLFDNGTLDLEVEAGGSASFNPRYSVLTTPYGGIPACAPAPLLQPNACQGNVVIGNGVNAAGFVAPSPPVLSVVGSRLNPGIAAVQIVDTTPPTGLAGDYHLATGSVAIDRGAGFSNFAPLGGQPLPNASSIFAPCSGTVAQNFPADIDGQFRPQVRTLRVATPWDVGADEVTPGVPVLISPSNPVAPWSCVGTAN